MIGRIFIAGALLLSAAAGQDAGSSRVAAGDTLEQVILKLGSPVVEYPLHDQWIHEFEQCTVISSNGTVLSVEYKEQEETPEPAPVVDDSPPTIEEIRQKAIQGDAESQYLLAYCFQFGQVVEQNYGSAVAWYTKSAMQGHMPAQHNLGFLFMSGKGVEQDYAQAYAWALLAAENGNNKLKRALDFKLSDDERQSALLLAEQLHIEMASAQQPEQAPPSAGTHAAD